jgi:hypothetical protein
VSIIDVGRLEVIGRIGDVGGWTGDMAITPDGKRLIVTAGTADRYALIDTRTPRVIATGVAGKGPHGVPLTPGGAHALVVNSLSGDPPNRLPGHSPGLAVVDLSQKKVVRTIPLGGEPLSVTVRP